MKKVGERLKDHHFKLDLTPEARDLLADIGYDPDMGARPLRRVIQNKIEDGLSDAILAGKFHDGDTVRIEAKDKEIVLVPEPQALPQAEEPEALPAA